MGYRKGVENEIEHEEVIDAINDLLVKTIRDNYLDTRSLILHFMESGFTILRSTSREQRIVQDRHLYSFLMYNLTRLTLQDISKTIRRDHSTVMNARRAVVDQLNTDREYRERFIRMLKDMNDLLTEKSMATSKHIDTIPEGTRTEEEL